MTTGSGASKPIVQIQARGLQMVMAIFLVRGAAKHDPARVASASTAAAARLVPPPLVPAETSGPAGATARDMVGSGAQELSAMNAVQHDRLGEAQVFAKPR
jgi:hypothetical protein